MRFTFTEGSAMCHEEPSQFSRKTLSSCSVSTAVMCMSSEQVCSPPYIPSPIPNGAHTRHQLITPISDLSTPIPEVPSIRQKSTSRPNSIKAKRSRETLPLLRASREDSPVTALSLSPKASRQCSPIGGFAPTPGSFPFYEPNVSLPTTSSAVRNRSKTPHPRRREELCSGPASRTRAKTAMRLKNAKPDTEKAIAKERENLQGEPQKRALRKAHECHMLTDNNVARKRKERDEKGKDRKPKKGKEKTVRGRRLRNGNFQHLPRPVLLFQFLRCRYCEGTRCDER